jgi:methyltransferase (TIGR00027 family)
MHIHKPSRTAEGIAAARAWESTKPEGERIFCDPYARHFLGPGYLLRRYLRPLGWFLRRRNSRILPGLYGGLILRTRHMDDHLVRCATEGLAQLVVLGAGYDARPYRFKAILSGVRVFEVDHPATQQIKMAKVKKIFGALPPQVNFVAVRFNSQSLKERLLQSGYRPDLKTLFIWEGVTMYISAQAVDDTLAFIAGQSPPGSWVVFDYFPPSIADGTSRIKQAQALRKMVARYGEAFRFGIAPQDIEAFLTRRGFADIENVSAEACKKRYLSAERAGLPVSQQFYFVIATVSNGKAGEGVGENRT